MSKEFTLDDIFGDTLNSSLEKESNHIEIEEIKEESKLVKVHTDGIEIIDEGLMNEIKRKNLSASMVSSIFECPADWMMNSFLLGKMDYEEPVHFVRGNIFHKTMEEFFRLPKEERNPKALSQLAMKVIKKDYEAYLTDRETMAWVKQALKGYLEGGFDYKNVDIAEIDTGKGVSPGIEILVKGKLGNTERDVVGFVDRIDRLEDGTLQIVDYKSGKRIYPFDPNKPLDDNNNFGYWRQQLAYSMLLEKDGYKIGGAKLEFPIAKGEVIVDVNNQEMRKQVEADFERADSMLTKCIEESFFPFNGHMFCKWCGMLSPNYTPSRFGKLNVSWEDVSQYVELLG